jgi:hypothetical protein
VIEMKAVLEVTGGDNVALSARMSREEFDAVLAAIADYGADDDAVFGPELLHALLEKEMIIAAGGVRVSDTATGARIEPGCCFGLENWRDWAGLLDGEEPWLGHSPTPGVELTEGVVRLWQDEEHRYGPVCEIPAEDLRGHLEGVRQDLVGFLGLVREWAPYGLGERLATAFDEHFHVSAPL